MNTLDAQNLDAQNLDDPRLITFIALGSNLGDRLTHLRFARSALAALPQSKLLRQSRIFETAPVGPPGQGAYLNAVIELETSLAAHELLESLLEIEQARGRRRAERWGARTLDLDILLYGDLVIETSSLNIPHLELQHRPFVLVPLAELIPERTLPKLGKTPIEMLRQLRMNTQINALTEDWSEMTAGVRATDLSYEP